MNACRARAPVAVALAGALALAAVRAPVYGQEPLPPLSNAEFRRLMTDFAETSGNFHSDNFTSNENGAAFVAAELAARKPGGAYIGVGPEQNFTYIAALRPQLAFIVDIRRQAVIQHLL
jgi:hypothetical protein